MSTGLLDPKLDFVFKNIFGYEKDPEMLISKEVKITIGTTNITIPVSETILIYSIIKELATKC
ncbi:hypothetical protein [Clostridium saccharoperbutylacetonicum]